MTDSYNAADLVRRGQAAARVGHREEARRYLRHAVKLDPANIQAWLDLAGVEDDTVAKMACFERVLELAPGNAEAQLGVEMLKRPERQTAGAAMDGEDELEAVIAAASRQLEEAVGPPLPGEVPPDEGVLYCANHPKVETMLRCNRCGKPICTRCAVQTPVGYRCKECVGRQQAVFYTGSALDYIIGGAIALVLGSIAAYLMSLLGAWFFALILGPTLGIGIAEVVRAAVRRRRSRYLWLSVGVGMVVGSLPALLLALTTFWALLTLGLFLILAVGAATARLR
jgi:tetratricopeptide (TPR) repeat protein